jgi:hypothetical protein
MTMNDECLWEEAELTEATVPQVLSRLIKSKGDALTIHHLIDSHIDIIDVGRDRCSVIGQILLEWDSFSFAEYFDGLQVECEQLNLLLKMPKEMKGLATVRILLQALTLAAERQAQELWSKFNSRRRTVQVA